MKKNVRTEVISNAYELIGSADYKSLSDKDKIALWKISRLMKPIAVKFLGDKSDAIKSFITPEFAEAFKKFQGFKTSGDNLESEEYKECAKTVLKANQLMEAALGELADKEVEVEFEPLSEGAVSSLLLGNNWPLAKAEFLEWMIEDNNL